MYKLITVLILIFSTIANSATISKTVLGSKLSITNSNSYGGAVTQLNFRGRQYIDTLDHGRLLQSAVSFNGYGECYNPTEGGSEAGSLLEQSTMLVAQYAMGNVLKTQAYMGFWLAPNRYYPSGCGGNLNYVYALNTTVTSNMRLDKQITIGTPLHSNVIVHDTSFRNIPSFNTAIFEASTVYVTSSFTNAISFNPDTGAVKILTQLGEQAYPVILYTPNLLHAIGIYSKFLPQNYFGSLVGYGWFGQTGIGAYNKSNCVFRKVNETAHDHSFQCMYIIGTLAEVKDTIIKLKRGI